ERGESGHRSRRRRDLFFAMCHPIRSRWSGCHTVLQAHRPLRLPDGFSAEIFHAADWSAGTDGAPRAVARAGKRVSHTGGGNGVRIVGRGYARGSGKGVQVVRSLELTGDGKWLNIFS